MYGADLQTPQGRTSEPVGTGAGALGFELIEKPRLELADAQAEWVQSPNFQIEGDLHYGNRPFSKAHSSQARLFGEALTPYYLPKIKNATVLAKLKDGSPALVSWQPSESAPRFFSILPYLPSNALQAIYRAAGISSLPPLGKWYFSMGRGVASVNTVSPKVHSRELSDWISSMPVLIENPTETPQGWLLLKTPTQ